MNKILHALSIITVSLSIFSHSYAQTISELNTLYSQGRFEETLSQAQQLLKSNPMNGSAYMIAGLAAMELRNSPLAENYLKKSVALLPKNSQALNNYGLYLCQQRNFNAAIQYFNEAASLSPKEADKFYVNAGICSNQQSDPDKAMMFFNKALSVNSDSKQALYELAHLYYKSGDYNRAQKSIQNFHRVSVSTSESLMLNLLIEKALGNKDVSNRLQEQYYKKQNPVDSTQLKGSSSLKPTPGEQADHAIRSSTESALNAKVAENIESINRTSLTLAARKEEQISAERMLTNAFAEKAALESQMTLTEERTRAAKKQIADLESTLKNSQNQLQDLQKQKNALEANIPSVLSQIESIRLETSQLNQTKIRSDSQLEALMTQKANLTQQINTLQASIQKNNQDQQSQATLIRDLEKQIKDLEQQKREIVQTDQVYSNRYKTLLTQKEQLEILLRDQNKISEEQKREYELLLKTVQDLKSKINALSSDSVSTLIRKQKEILAQHQDSLSSMTQENRSLSQTLEKLQNETKETDRLIQAAHENKNRMLTSISQMQPILESRKKDLDTLRVEISPLEKRYQEIQSLQSDTEQNIFSTQSKIANLQTAISSFERQSQDLSRKIEVKSKDIPKLQNEFEQAKEKVANLERQLASIDSQFKQYQEQIAVLRATEDSLKAKLANSDKNHQAFVREQNKATSDVAMLQQTINELDEKIKNSTSSKIAFDATFSRLQNEIQDKQRFLQQILRDSGAPELKINNLQTTISKLDGDIAALQATSKKAQPEFARLERTIMDLTSQKQSLINEQSKLAQRNEEAKSIQLALTNEISFLKKQLQENSTDSIKSISDLQSERDYISKQLEQILAVKDQENQKRIALTRDAADLRKTLISEENALKQIKRDLIILAEQDAFLKKALNETLSARRENQDLLNDLEATASGKNKKNKPETLFLK